MAIGIQYGLSQHDEGAFVYTATRVMNGEIPYRDFWTFYPPGQFYLLAFLFKIFGKSLIAVRILSIILQSSIVICIYILVKKIVNKNCVAFITAILAILYVPGPFNYGYYSYPIIPAMLFSILSCILLINFISDQKNSKIIFAGLLTGVTALFRHDIGFYTFLSEIIVLIIFLRNFRYISVKCVLRYFVGFSIIVLPTFIFFIYHVGFNELISNLIIFPIVKYPEYRSLPYPSPTAISEVMINIIGNNTILYKTLSFLQYIPFYFPVIVFVFAIIQIIFYIKNKKVLVERELLIILLVLFGITFFNQARIRSGTCHLFATIIPAIILSPMIIYNLIQKNSSKILHGIVIFFIIPLIFLSLGFDSIKLKLSYLIRLYTSELAPLEFKVSKNIVVLKNIAKETNNTVNFIRSKTPIGEKIFVANPRHDKVFVTDMMFYFLSERDSATKYYDLHPGLVTTKEIQKKIIEELNRFNVQYIVVWEGKSEVSEPNKSSKSSNCFELDNFIVDNYREIKRFPTYQILKRI